MTNMHVFVRTQSFSIFSTYHQLTFHLSHTQLYHWSAYEPTEHKRLEKPFFLTRICYSVCSIIEQHNGMLQEAHRYVPSGHGISCVVPLGQ